MSKLLITAFVLLLGAHWSSPALARQTLLVLGDSLSAAYGVAMESGWVSLLDRHLSDAEIPVTVVNASISGETTQGGLARLPNLLAQHQPGLVIIELGANDGLRGFPLHLIRANLKQLISLSKESGAQVLLLGMRIPPNYGAKYTSLFYETYQQLAQQENTGLVPFLLDGVAAEDTMMQEDGLHPNSEAQPILLQNVLPALLPLLQETAALPEAQP
jgi:acyl-CoA thioesterase-1